MSTKEMLINFVPDEESRIAIIEDGHLEELYQERASSESHVGNIYKGRVVNVESSIQAAFIEFGLERNGFLHISDLHPMYFPGEHKEETEMVGQKTPRRDRPPIQKCLRRGQEILVQVLKEGIGTKGPTLTSYLSIPGRFLVMMPNMERLGVSRKVEDDESRREMRDILRDLNPPDGFGFIVRTAGMGRNKTELKRDLAYLLRLWKVIDQKMKSNAGVGELYTESDLVVRTIRDVFTTDIHRIVVDNPVAAQRSRDFLAIASPRSDSRVMLYRDPIPLFHRFGVESQIENIHARVVPLPSGGSLVIDSTEALVAIDVNSGKSRENRDAETTAYKTNLEAADEICRQLRLRDLGGVVVNDLIDMYQAKHRREVEQRFRLNLKKDRARTHVLAISELGILEMTRQRMRPSLTKSTYQPCPHCHGAGQVKSAETVALDVMRRLALVMHRPQFARIILTVSPDVAFEILNRKRAQLVALEQQHGKPVTVRVSPGGPIDFIEMEFIDSRGGAIDLQEQSNLGEPALEVFEAVSADIDLGDPDEIQEVEEAGEGEDSAIRGGEGRREEAAGPGSEAEPRASVGEEREPRFRAEPTEASSVQEDVMTPGLPAAASLVKPIPGSRHPQGQVQQQAGQVQGGSGRSRRRRRRRARGRGGAVGASASGSTPGQQQPSGSGPQPTQSSTTPQAAALSRPAPQSPPVRGQPQGSVGGGSNTQAAQGGQPGSGRRRRRRRGGRGRGGQTRDAAQPGVVGGVPPVVVTGPVGVGYKNVVTASTVTPPADGNQSSS